MNASLFVANSVVNGINKLPNNVTTMGEGPVTGEEVEITITFTSPIVLPPGHYFFRPEVLLTSGDFLYLSAPRPIVPPGNPFLGDLQAWIRNSNLNPDWLRIGTDIIGGATPPTFNMAFSLKGETVPQTGTPGQANCLGQTNAAHGAAVWRPFCGGLNPRVLERGGASRRIYAVLRAIAADACAGTGNAGLQACAPVGGHSTDSRK